MPPELPLLFRLFRLLHCRINESGDTKRTPNGTKNKPKPTKEKHLRRIPKNKQNPKGMANLAKIYGQFCTFLMCENHSAGRPETTRPKGMETCFRGVYLKIMPHYLWLDSSSCCRLRSQHRKKMHFQFLFPGQCSQFCSFEQPQENNQLGWHPPGSCPAPESVACKCTTGNDNDNDNEHNNHSSCGWGQRVGRCTVHLHSS